MLTVILVTDGNGEAAQKAANEIKTFMENHVAFCRGQAVSACVIKAGEGVEKLRLCVSQTEREYYPAYIVTFKEGYGTQANYRLANKAIEELRRNRCAVIPDWMRIEVISK